jgi:hypothetical protein
MLPSQSMTKAWTYDEGEPGLRRFSTRGLPYHGRHDDRFQSDGVRYSTRAYVHAHEAPQSDQDSEQDSKGNRRRIPVAVSSLYAVMYRPRHPTVVLTETDIFFVQCGRCRKRKIRCSGAQNDSSCSNCKSAGNDDCQFNRVLIHKNTCVV